MKAIINANMFTPAVVMAPVEFVCACGSNNAFDSGEIELMSKFNKLEDTLRAERIYPEHPMFCEVTCDAGGMLNIYRVVETIANDSRFSDKVHNLAHEILDY